MSQHGVGGPLGGFLERFRGTGGVPAGVGGEVASELAALFGALDEIEREAQALRLHAAAEGQARAARLEREVAEVNAEGHRRADAARDEAFETARRAAEADAAAIVAAGEKAAAAILDTGTARLPALVEAVVARATGTAR